MASDRLSLPTVVDQRGCLLVPLSCSGCGHDLRNLVVTGFCPQCGRPIRQSAGTLLPELDEAGRIQSDVPCLNCGYNLRTRLIGELCPECAADVALSIRSDYLHLAPPEWLNRITSGARLLFISITASLIMPFIAMFLVFAATISGTTPPSRFVGLMLLLVVFGVLLLVLLILGVIRLTTREPGAEYLNEGLSARKLARTSLVLIGASFVLTLCYMPVAAFGARVTLFTTIPFVIISLVSLVAYFVLPLAMLKHFIGLTRRIPRPGLVTYCKIEFWGLLVCGLLYFVGYPLLMWNAVNAAAAMPMTAMPNMPGSPNTPTSNTTPRQLARLGYLNPSGAPPAGTTTTVTTFGGASTTIVTTAPTAISTMPAPGPLWVLSMIVTGLSGCGLLIAGVAGYILLILIWRALVAASRLAEENLGGYSVG